MSQTCDLPLLSNLYSENWLLDEWMHKPENFHLTDMRQPAYILSTDHWSKRDSFGTTLGAPKTMLNKKANSEGFHSAKYVLKILDMFLQEKNINFKILCAHSMHFNSVVIFSWNQTLSRFLFNSSVFQLHFPFQSSILPHDSRMTFFDDLSPFSIDALLILSLHLPSMLHVLVFRQISSICSSLSE